MSSYKVGDLSKLFDSGQGLTKSPAVESGKKKKSKKYLFGAAKRVQDKSESQDVSKDDDIAKANKMKAKIEKEKARQALKREDSDTKTGGPSSPEENKSLKRKHQGKEESTSDTKSLEPHETEKVGKKKNKKSKLDSDPETNIQKDNDRKNKKSKDSTSEKVSGNQSGFDPKGLVHESLLQKGKKRAIDDDNVGKDGKPVKKKKKTEEDLDKPKRKRLRNKASTYDEENKRTIFVGNLSLELSEKEITKMFKEFGEIESIRRRCVPVKDPDQLKRVAAIKKEFHPERNNSNCYIKFKTEEAAKKSLVNNGKLVKNLHIRVDIAFGEVVKDTKRTVFVANLPFDVEEESIWAHFEDCGDIDNVRIIRDRKTCLGKGIGYVKFKDPSCVSLALKLHGSAFKDRKLRVTVCDYNKAGEKKKSKSGKPKIPFSKKNKLKSSGGDGFQGEKAKKPKKKRNKSNVKSSAVFPPNKAPNTVNKTFDKQSSISVGGPSINKHVKFDDDKSGKSKGNFHKGKSSFNTTASAKKGKHIVFD